MWLVGLQCLNVFLLSLAVRDGYVEFLACICELFSQPLDCNLFGYLCKLGCAIGLLQPVLVAERSILVGVGPIECDNFIVTVNDHLTD